MSSNGGTGRIRSGAAFMCIFVAAVALSGLAACYPINVKPECRSRVDECLKACPTSPADSNDGRMVYSGMDTRSDCQRRCHEMCAQAPF